MYKDKKILAVIPARGGSRRLPGKNIKLLGDKPLIAWTIECAQKSSYIDKLILSSDDSDIINVARKCGCCVPFIRPAELATSLATSEAMLEHAIISMNERYDYVVLLQPTSPFRQTVDIDDCIKLCIDKNAPSVESMTEISENPAWMFNVDDNNTFSHACNITSNAKIYILNGAIYVINCNEFLKSHLINYPDTLVYIMPRDRSVDIDTAEDFSYAEYLLQRVEK